MQTFDVLTSVCERVTLVNGEVTRDRIMCGFAFLDSYAGERVYFPNNTAIEISPLHRNRPTPVTLSSENDDIQFTLCPSN